MAKEKQAMQSHCFTSIMDFVKKVETEGISANEGEVAIPPQKMASLDAATWHFKIR